MTTRNSSGVKKSKCNIALVCYPSCV